MQHDADTPNPLRPPLVGVLPYAQPSPPCRPDRLVIAGSAILLALNLIVVFIGIRGVLMYRGVLADLTGSLAHAGAGGLTVQGCSTLWRSQLATGLIVFGGAMLSIILFCFAGAAHLDLASRLIGFGLSAVMGFVSGTHYRWGIKVSQLNDSRQRSLGG